MRRSIVALTFMLAACDPAASPDVDAPGSMLDAPDPSRPDTPAIDGAVSFMPGVVPEEAPSWVADLVPGTWSAISLDTIRDHDPAADPALNPNHPSEAPWRGGSGLGGLIAAWGGGALASGHGTHGTFLVYGGGHGDYHGNEVYGFDLGSRRWSRLSAPYPTPVFETIDAYPDGMYPDGSPVPSHTSDRLEYHLATNSFVTLEAEINAFGGYVVPNPFLFSLDGGHWRRGAPSEMGIGAIGWSAYDSRRDVFWTSGGCCTDNPIAAFDPDAANGDGTYGTWQFHTTRPELNVNASQAAYDPVHDQVAITSFREGTNVYAFSAAMPDDAPRVVSTTGAPPALEQGHGWEWSPAREAFLYWAGDHVHELRPTDGDWTWLDVTNPAGTVVPEYTENGVYSRFRVMSYGSLDVIVTVGSVDGSVYAFRVPARG